MGEAISAACMLARVSHCPKRKSTQYGWGGLRLSLQITTMRFVTPMTLKMMTNVAALACVTFGVTFGPQGWTSANVNLMFAPVAIETMQGRQGERRFPAG